MLFSSQTGVSVHQSLEKLSAFSAARGRAVLLSKVEGSLKDVFATSFPTDPLTDDICSAFGMQYLLQKPKKLLIRLWEQAIKLVATAPPPETTRFLSLHPVLYHSESREFFSPLDAGYLKDVCQRAGLRVKLVVSLIDDVYDVYSRLRAPNQMLHPPEPKSAFQESVQAILDLMLLLDWRSNEIMAAEQIARSMDADHYVLAVKHPLSVAYDLLFTEKAPVYVSHPISHIRKLEAEGNRTAANDAKAEINELIRLLTQNPSLVPFYPTTIDEFRMDAEGDYLVPRLRARWPHGEPTNLLYSPPTHPINPLDPRNSYTKGRTPRPSNLRALNLLLRTLTDRIMMQIGARDRKLVEQSRGLAVFRPYFDGIPSLGVQAEVSYRTALVRYGVARPEERVCVVANPDNDFLKLRIRFLVSELARRTTVIGRAPTSSRVERIARSLVRKKQTRENICRSVLTGGDLQKAVGNDVHRFIFEGMPQAYGPLGGEPRITQRIWLSEQWDKLAAQMNSFDPLQSQLTDSDIVLNSRTSGQLVERVESLFGASNQE